MPDTSAVGSPTLLVALPPGGGNKKKMTRDLKPPNPAHTSSTQCEAFYLPLKSSPPPPLSPLSPLSGGGFAN